MPKKEKYAYISIAPDPINKGKEQVRIYQKDFKTVSVAIGKIAKVPLWVAKIAKTAGDIEDYTIVE